MKVIWDLCLLFLMSEGLRAVHAAPVRRRTSEVKDKAAPKEEVNILLFGILQFSESLNYVHETTEAKMVKIRQTLRSHEGTLEKLNRQTEQAAEVERQIKAAIEMLQAQMAKQQAQTKMTKDWLASVEQEEVELQTKVKKLEMYLNTIISIKELQKRAEEQSNTLKGLQHWTQFQKENIETQNEQLSKLNMMTEAKT
ncbi:Angiopoietin-like protein 8 [Dissostichus eleginoides]|uniref:Angiopoietin-like protein 8 n=1 Tax=Dissostichus eleginoides TaxID=100907 RepID=A0AAD9B602_DISEL|nr:Angiopoietin-like protein 8 [Dissostichus eleginoides]